MLHARYIKHTLNFRRPAGTSRGTLLNKDSYFIILTDSEIPGVSGIGECNILPGLSPDDRPDLEKNLEWACQHPMDIIDNHDILTEWPAIHFAFEMAFADLNTGGKQLLFHSAFTLGQQAIPINGLIWMGQPDFMLQQIDDKLRSGFNTIKMKIGAISFAEELNLLRYIRSQYGPEDITLRVDANGAFSAKEALGKLHQLAEFNIHSIEQPLKAGQMEAMAELCLKSPIPVALDEELIGINRLSTKAKLLQTIKPQFIIIKPALLGGFRASAEWIHLAEKQNTEWWVTSALESDIGLNAIAQWTATLNNPLPQGLGTGSLFTNNFPSPLQVKNGSLYHNPSFLWDISTIR